MYSVYIYIWWYSIYINGYIHIDVHRVGAIIPHPHTDIWPWKQAPARAPVRTGPCIVCREAWTKHGPWDGARVSHGMGIVVGLSWESWPYINNYIQIYKYIYSIYIYFKHMYVYIYMWSYIIMGFRWFHPWTLDFMLIWWHSMGCSVMVNLITIKKGFTCISKYGNIIWLNGDLYLLGIVMWIQTAKYGDSMGIGEWCNQHWWGYNGKITGYVSNNAVATDWVGSSVSTN